MRAVRVDRRIGAAIAAGLLALAVGVAPALGAVANDGEPSLAPPLTSHVSLVANPYLTPAQGLHLAVGVTTASAPLDGVRASAAITTVPLTSGEAIDAFMSNPTASPTREIASGEVMVWEAGAEQPPGRLDAHRSRAISLSADPATLALPAGTTGVYGVVVTASAQGVEPQTHAFVIGWVDAPVAPVNVSVVATVSGTPERAHGVLTAASDPYIALLIDPTAWALIDPERRPDLAGREAYALPAGHLDVSSAVHAGTEALLDFAIQRSADLAPQPWPWIAAPATVDASITDAMATRGARAILAGPQLSQTLPAQQVPVANLLGSDGVEIPVVLTHPRLSRAMAGTHSSDAARSARVIAETILDASLHPGEGERTIVVAPGESWFVDGTQPSDTISTLFAVPWVKPVALTHALSLTGRGSIQAPETAATTDDVGAGDLMVVQQRLNQLLVLAESTSHPSVIMEGSARELLRSVAVTQRRDTDARALAITHALDVAKETLESVRVTSGSELTLVSNSGNVPVTVRNDLGADVSVRVAMTSMSPNLLIDEQPMVTIAAGTEQTVLVPITAIASDDVPVIVSLRAESGAAISSASTLNVRVRAEWGNAVTGVFTGGLVVLLLAGIYRTIKRGQRDTRVAPTTDGDELTQS